jgi:hypothetical protein
MAQKSSAIQGGLDRVETTLRSLEKDWKRIQKKADQRRRNLEKRAEKQVKRLQRELRGSKVVQRAGSLGSDARKRVEEGVDALLGGLRIASHADVARLERKVSALNRKVRALETRKSGSRRTKAA